MIGSKPKATIAALPLRPTLLLRGHAAEAGNGKPVRHITARSRVIRPMVFVPGDGNEDHQTLPDAQWRLLVALARWAGLRIPSEALALTWQDVDIRADGSSSGQQDNPPRRRGVRVVPMFPELVPSLGSPRTSPEGSTHVLTRFQEPATCERCFDGTLPGPASRLAQVWQNLRVSRATG